MVEPNLIEHLTGKDLFGSQTNLAKAAGCAAHTICGKRNSPNPLTYQQMRRILATAAEQGIALTPDDFFPDFQRAA